MLVQVFHYPLLRGDEDLALVIVEVPVFATIGKYPEKFMKMPHIQYEKSVLPVIPKTGRMLIPC